MHGRILIESDTDCGFPGCQFYLEQPLLRPPPPFQWALHKPFSDAMHACIFIVHKFELTQRFFFFLTFCLFSRTASVHLIHSRLHMGFGFLAGRAGLGHAIGHEKLFSRPTTNGQSSWSWLWHFGSWLLAIGACVSHFSIKLQNACPSTFSPRFLVQSVYASVC